MRYFLDGTWAAIDSTVCCLCPGRNAPLIAMAFRLQSLLDLRRNAESEAKGAFDRAMAARVMEVAEQSRLVAKQLASHIVKFGGAGLIVDYGYTAPPGSATLDAWSRLRPADILERPGETDVTADVDFGALHRAAEEEGAFAPDIIMQGEFLSKMGIRARADFLKTQASKRVKKKIDKDMQMLVSPSKMGALWKVMVMRAVCIG